MKYLILFSVILISLTGSGQVVAKASHFDTIDISKDTLCVHNWKFSGTVYETAPPIYDQVCTKCKIHRDEPFKMGKHGGEPLFPNDTTETIEDLVNRAIAVQNKEFISSSDSAFISKLKSNYTKTDTTKGWIRYWKRTLRYIGDVTIPTIYIEESFEPAISIEVKQYEEVPCEQPKGILILITGCHEWITKSSKILVNGKEFDLSKKYEFIKEEEIVK